MFKIAGSAELLQFFLYVPHTSCNVRIFYEKHRAGEETIGYTWDWSGARRGAWSPDGEETSINRYLLDFRSMVQKNIDNHRVRSFRITWVLPEQIEAVWTGEIVRD